MADQIFLGESRARFSTLRDWFSMIFSHRRLVMLSFAGTFLGATLFAVLVVAYRYEAKMRIMVNKQRLDPAVTPELNGATQIIPPPVTEDEINSEVELLQSEDLLRQVVLACGLAEKERSFFYDKPENMRVYDATRHLAKKLKIEPVRKTDLIEVTYASSDAELSANVLKTLTKLYLAKHVEVHRPAGASDFFERQAEQYQKKLLDAEARLASYSQGHNVSVAQLERDVTVQKLAESSFDLQQTQALVAETQQRVRNLEAQATIIPERVSTQQHTSDAFELMQQLKSTLLNLQLRRTELLTKFDPSYPLVKEVETEIAQTQEALTKAEQTRNRDETTDRNPTHELLRQELARARADLASFKGRGEALNNVVHHYQQAALQLGQNTLDQQDLLRQVKTNEDSYLLYVQKAQQERAADALDAKRISNVAITEAPSVPLRPAWPPALVVALGFFLALSVAAGTAWVAEKMDGSFRTPDEVREFLDLPVIASVPKDGEAPVFVPGPRSGGHHPSVSYDA
jgi:uncharacterized protein involved in exopolysaccharide biosynthesis